MRLVEAKGGESAMKNRQAVAETTAPYQDRAVQLVEEWHRPWRRTGYGDLASVDQSRFGTRVVTHRLAVAHHGQVASDQAGCVIEPAGELLDSVQLWSQVGDGVASGDGDADRQTGAEAQFPFVPIGACG